MVSIYVILYLIGWPIGIYGMFKKAGVAPWKAFIPFYNTWIICNLCGINKLWFWLQFIPIAGQFITIWMTIIFVMQFGKFSFIDHTLTTLVPFVYLPYIGFSKDVRYVGPEGVKHYKKSTTREWVDALVFATVAATIIRTFIFEAYVIPTGSMEKTLLINDFLFVDKMTYGARVPETPVSFPFVHNFMPFSTTVPSYTKLVHLKYRRLPAFGEIKRNDVVVFNFPAGDTIINEAGYGSELPYYQVLREQYHGDRATLFAQHKILVHPIDKTDNYIKRCTGIAGDTIQIINTELYVNGKKAYIPPTSQMEYLVTTNGNAFSDDVLRNQIHIKIDPVNASDEPEFSPQGNNQYIFDATADEIAQVKKLPNVVNVQFYIQTNHGLFPYYSESDSSWTPDNFGPLWIPKKGVTVTLTQQNLPIYRRIITTYEHHILTENNGQFVIDGKPTNQYTFQYNYYWMMGDNRHRSQDSRYWGFVPETAVVGKASLIWFSWQNGPRWKRIFKVIK
ncbi:S26 family signal peptidase [Arachidicoccus sp.]|uniref:S26 family signal peptidase n=1 Tax=Arachidicoccus sp. TaxID=1872624 RepID=UPI003D1FE6E5